MEGFYHEKEVNLTSYNLCVYFTKGIERSKEQNMYPYKLTCIILSCNKMNVAALTAIPTLKNGQYKFEIPR